MDLLEVFKEFCNSNSFFNCRGNNNLFDPIRFHGNSLCATEESVINEFLLLFRIIINSLYCA